MRRTSTSFNKKTDSYGAKLKELENENERLKKMNKNLLEMRELQHKRDMDFINLQTENFQLRRELERCKYNYEDLKREVILFKKKHEKEITKNENN